MRNEVENQGVKVANEDHTDDAGDDAGNLDLAVAHDATSHIVADPAVIFEH